MWAVILLFACVADPGDTGGISLDTGPDILQSEPIVAELAPEDVEPALQIAIGRSLFLPIQITPWAETVLNDLSVNGTGNCPSRDDSEDVEGAWTSFWLGSCTGAVYQADGTWQIAVNHTDSGDGTLTSVVELHSLHGSVIATGEEINAGGVIFITWEAQETFARVAMSANGEWLDQSRTDLMGAGFSTGIEMSGSVEAGPGYTGTVKGPIDDVNAPFDLDLNYTSECLGSTGTIRVRDPSSGWWTVTMSDDCSGCGALSYYGEELGQVCAGELLKQMLDERLVPLLGKNL